MTLILRAEYGSRAYGTYSVDSDHDMVEVIVEPREYVTGLSTWDTKHNSTAGDGNRSTREDTDTTVYGLHKFADLAVTGNLSVLGVLFLPEYESISESGQMLVDNRSICVSKSAGHRFLGYMESQRKAITGERNKRTNRPELTEQFGWDVKFGMHAIRLGYLGLELMSTGSIELPMSGMPLRVCRAIRGGEVTKDQGLALIEDLGVKLESAIDQSTFPERGDREVMSKLLHTIYTSEWESR